MRSMALLYVGHDFGVAMLDLKIVGLMEEKGEVPSWRLEEIQEDLRTVIPKLREMYHIDMALRDMNGRKYSARFYTDSGIVHYVVLISSEHTLRAVVRRLKQQGWKLLLSIEQKPARKTYETS